MLGGQVGLDEHKLKEHEEMIQSFESDYSRVLFRIHALEQGRKSQMDLIEALQMDLAFHEPNSSVDTQRLQCLEEQFDDLLNVVAQMQDKLCTYGGKVRVLLL